jgi:NAD-dependent dihydropyrimidine dehydrogenase PreA subunit
MSKGEPLEITIDRNKCEGKADCLQACSQGVYELKEPDLSELGWLIKLKLKFHGGKQAFAVAPERCEGCEACVAACPENAIQVKA